MHISMHITVSLSRVLLPEAEIQIDSDKINNNEWKIWFDQLLRQQHSQLG